MGVCLSLSRLGSVVNNVLSPYLWSHGKFSLWGGAIFCGASLGCTLLLAPVDRLAAAKLRKLNPAAAEIAVDDENIKLSDVKKFTAPFWLLTFSCITVYVSVLFRVRIACSRRNPTRWLPKRSLLLYRSSDKILYRRAHAHTHMYTCAHIRYGSVIPFNSIASSLFQHRDYLNTDNATQLAISLTRTLTLTPTMLNS
jgi:hypothetical protein